MKLKICGMREPYNISRVLSEIEPDYLGFIFFEKSPRYVLESLNANIQTYYDLTQNVQKVGVFVNASVETVQDFYLKYKLDYVQLHGDEDLKYIAELNKVSIPIIKVSRVKTLEDIRKVSLFKDQVKYVLLDTYTPAYGGAGKAFNWEFLQEYEAEIPFFLSGGLNLSNLEKLKSIDHPYLYGIDVNSGFELEPGLKDLDSLTRLRTFLNQNFPSNT